MKRQTRNADGSDRYAPDGPHFNDGRAWRGPVRTVGTAVLVDNFDAQTRFNDEMRPKISVVARWLEYGDAEPWDSIWSMPPKDRPPIEPQKPLEIRKLSWDPPTGAADRARAIRARMAARFDRKTFVSGI